MKSLQADSSISVAHSPNKPISHLEGSRAIFTFGLFYVMKKSRRARGSKTPREIMLSWCLMPQPPGAEQGLTGWGAGQTPSLLSSHQVM